MPSNALMLFGAKASVGVGANNVKSTAALEMDFMMMIKEDYKNGGIL